MSKAKTIVRLAFFANRTPTGRRSATAARKLTMYLGYGRGPEHEQQQRPLRGLWHDQDGKMLRHREVLAWVAEQGRQQGYTYELVLSVKYADLDEEEYTQALKAGGELFPAWRLMRHDDSQYSHAHVLAFDDRQILIKDPAFQAWCQRVRHALEQTQTHHLVQSQEAEQLAALSNEQDNIQENVQGYQHDWGWGL
jgi:hypothetical protein